MTTYLLNSINVRILALATTLCLPTFLWADGYINFYRDVELDADVVSHSKTIQIHMGSIECRNDPSSDMQTEAHYTQVDTRKAQAEQRETTEADSQHFQDKASTSHSAAGQHSKRGLSLAVSAVRNTLWALGSVGYVVGRYTAPAFIQGKLHSLLETPEAGNQPNSWLQTSNANYKEGDEHFRKVTLGTYAANAVEESLESPISFLKAVKDEVVSCYYSYVAPTVSSLYNKVKANVTVTAKKAWRKFKSFF